MAPDKIIKYKAQIYNYFEEATPLYGFDKSLQSIRFHLSNKNIDIEFLLDKYEKYLKWWKMKYSGRKYIAKDENKKDLLTFLINNMYDITYKHDKSERDKYIFGDYDPDDLEEAIKWFLKKYNLPLREAKNASE